MGPEVVPRIWIRLAEVNLGKVRIGHVQGLVHYFLFMGKPANDTDALGIWRFHTICCLWKKFILDITQIYCHSFFYRIKTRVRRAKNCNWLNGILFYDTYISLNLQCRLVLFQSCGRLESVQYIHLFTFSLDF